jgi:putative colanic acid biosynthesis UDP-glucose lipid carrier transferase
MSLFSKLYIERRSNKFSEEIVFVIYHTILFSVSLSSVLFFLNLNHKFPSRFILLFVFITAFLAILTKYAFRKKIHAALIKGNFYDNVLLIGSNAAAVNFIDTVQKYYYYGYKCLGYIEESAKLAPETHYFGNFDALENVLMSNNIDEVFIALSTNDHEKIQHCINICDANRVKIRILPDLTDYTSSSIYINNIGLLPVVNIGHLPLDRTENQLLKRAFDIVFATLFFLLIGIWLFPFIALAIKLSSKGPVFFKQERWGHNNQMILCYKFRSMVKDSTDIDEDGNYNQAYKNDPRITSIGRILRKSNMDELPQFWNVLLGNMSVVGPRPHPTPLNLASMQTVDNYMLRHLVKPGISGLAQVNGCRGETKTTEEMQRRINFDLYYIHRWTFWLDIQIIIQTVVNLVRGDQNAY